MAAIAQINSKLLSLTMLFSQAVVKILEVNKNETIADRKKNKVKNIKLIFLTSSINRKNVATDKLTKIVGSNKSKESFGLELTDKL